MELGRIMMEIQFFPVTRAVLRLVFTEIYFPFSAPRKERHLTGSLNVFLRQFTLNS